MFSFPCGSFNNSVVLCDHFESLENKNIIFEKLLFNFFKNEKNQSVNNHPNNIIFYAILRLKKSRPDRV